MAAGTWKVFDKAKGMIGDSTIDLSDGKYYIGLCRASASTNISADAALTTWASCVRGAAATVGFFEASGGGYYTDGGNTVTTPTWTVGASAGQWKFDGVDTVFTASASSLDGIYFAVIRNSTGAAAGKALAFVTLTGTQFDLAAGNTLTVQYNASGIFTLA